MVEIIVSILLVIAILFGLFVGFVVWGFYTETELFSDVSYNGHTVKVVQKGHPFLTSKYRVFIIVDGIEQCALAVYLPNRTKNDTVYPAEFVVCEQDDESQYVISFGAMVYDYYSTLIKFDPTFSKVLYVRACYYAPINKSIKLGHYEAINVHLFS